MKKILLSILLLLSVFVSESQINMIRHRDDFTAFKKDTVKTGFDKLKSIKMGRDVFVSFGGDLKEQLQYFDNNNFGDGPPGTIKTDVVQLWHRLMLHSNIEIGSKTRIFVQLGSTFRIFNPNPLTPEIDENQLSLHQAFIDYSFSKKWTVRAGRQEVTYGNNRLLTFREGPNTRLAFDAAIIKHSSPKRYIDFFAMSPVISRQYVFDDDVFEDAVLGVYGTEIVVPGKLLIDYNFINFNSKRRRYNYVAGKENRQNFGLRLFSKNPLFNYELEANYQTGKFNDLKIDAYAFFGDLNYTLSKQHKLIAGVGGIYATGDKSNTDNKLNTYNIFYSRALFGVGAPIGATNVKSVNPYIKISPTKKLDILSSVYIIKKVSTEDGSYAPLGDPIRPSPRELFVSQGRGIGTLYLMETNYFVNKNLSIGIDATWMKAGSYVKQTGKGQNLTYMAFKFSYKF